MSDRIGQGGSHELWRLSGPTLQAVAAGALAALAFPPFGFWPGLLGFSLLLRQLDQAEGPGRLRRAFARGWAAGFSYFLISTWWVGEAFLVDVAVHGWQAPFAVLLLAGGLALLWGAAAWLYRIAAPRGGSRLLVFAAAFSLLEWLRGHVLTGFPWDLPGEAWAAGSPLSQGAALVGSYGMSFVTLLVGASLALRRRSDGAGVILAPVGAGVLLAAVFVYGAARLERASTLSPGALRIRIVQANVPQTEKWSPEALRSIILRYAALTAQPAKPAPDLIVWPEAAIPQTLDDVLSPDSGSGPLIAAALHPGQTLLLGAVVVDSGPAGPLYYNSFVGLRRTPAGLAVLGRYDKHHLVPFGEYMPLDSLASRIGFKTLVHIGPGFTPGPPSVALSLPGVPPFQPLICYESLFPGAFARTGARPLWIANVSNDAWFGDTSGPWQHLNLASYRAIEEGVPLVRSTPTGVSAMVDAYGRTTAKISLGREGVIDAPLPPALAPTVYARWRDLPFSLMLLTGAAAAGLGRRPAPGGLRRSRPGRATPTLFGR